MFSRFSLLGLVLLGCGSSSPNVEHTSTSVSLPPIENDAGKVNPDPIDSGTLNQMQDVGMVEDSGVLDAGIDVVLDAGSDTAVALVDSGSDTGIDANNPLSWDCDGTVCTNRTTGNICNHNILKTGCSYPGKTWEWDCSFDSHSDPPLAPYFTQNYFSCQFEETYNQTEMATYKASYPNVWCCM